MIPNILSSTVAGPKPTGVVRPQKVLASSYSLDGINAAEFVPISPELKNKPVVDVSLLFKTKATAAESAQLATILGHITSKPTSQDLRGELSDISLGLCVARRFLFNLEDDTDGHDDLLISESQPSLRGLSGPGAVSNPADWTLHKSLCLATSAPSLEERASRPYLAVRYLSLAGHVSLSVENQPVLAL